jgi:predicted lipase
VSHSLGAALATLTAFEFQASGINNVQIFNYGSPRVGNQEFADWASNGGGGEGKMKITRCTHYKDMVPHVPLHHRFRHVAGMINCCSLR